MGPQVEIHTKPALPPPVIAIGAVLKAKKKFLCLHFCKIVTIFQPISVFCPADKNSGSFVHSERGSDFRIRLLRSLLLMDSSNPVSSDRTKWARSSEIQIKCSVKLWEGSIRTSKVSGGKARCSIGRLNFRRPTSFTPITSTRNSRTWSLRKRASSITLWCSVSKASKLIDTKERRPPLNWGLFVCLVGHLVFSAFA